MYCSGTCSKVLFLFSDGYFGEDHLQVLNLLYIRTDTLFSSLGKSMDEIKKLLLLVLGCAVQVNIH